MADSKQSSAGARNESQYHHFIPRFILKNFAHLYQKPRENAKRRQKGPMNGDQMLYTIDLAGQGDVKEVRLAKSFGIQDMYRDFHAAGEQHDLEQRLSKLESKAGEIIALVRKEHASGKPHVWMTRKDRNCLRKFLFIMKYRCSRFHERYNHQTAEEYCANDKEKMLKYMKEKGFSRPIDVWLNNIRCILDLKMEANLGWAADLAEKMYPEDARWAFVNIQMMYLAFCTPADADDEFLLSENLFNIFEGPVSISINPDTGEETTQAYTEYHCFAAITPRLMIVLRSNVLPNPYEDKDLTAKNNRQSLYNAVRAPHNNPITAVSILEDLPVQKADNSYSEISEGRWRLKRADWMPHAEDKFQFKYFPIGSDHVCIINKVVLEETHQIGSVCFFSKAATKKTLEWYLSYRGDGPGDPFKHFNGPKDPRIATLQKLAHAANQLGSNVQAFYTFRDLKKVHLDKCDELDRWLRQDNHNLGLQAGYLALGGCGKYLLYDMDQASKMVYLRVKIDVCSKGLEEAKRNDIRENLIDLFKQLPPRRFYLYVKHWRTMLQEKYRENEDIPLDDITMNGPEDAIAQAAGLFHNGCVNRILYCAMMHDIEKTRRYGLDIDVPYIARRRLYTHREEDIKIHVRLSGICDCGKSKSVRPRFTANPIGIAVVEKKAHEIKRLFEHHPPRVSIPNVPLTLAQKTEIAIRCHVKAEFYELVTGSRPTTNVTALAAALFGTVFCVQIG